MGGRGLHGGTEAEGYDFDFAIGVGIAVTALVLLGESLSSVLVNGRLSSYPCPR